MNYLDIITKTAPIIIVVLAYFVHLEVRLTKMSDDIGWIKKNIKTCQPD